MVAAQLPADGRMSPHLFVFTASALVAVAPAISLARHHAPRAVRAGPIMASAMRPPPPPAFVPADSSKTTRKPRRSSRSQSSPLRAHRRHILSLCGALTSVVCAEAVVSQALPLVLADTFGSPVQVPPVCELGSATRDELQRVICRQARPAARRHLCTRYSSPLINARNPASQAISRPARRCAHRTRPWLCLSGVGGTGPHHLHRRRRRLRHASRGRLTLRRLRPAPSIACPPALGAVPAHRRRALAHDSRPGGVQDAHGRHCQL